MGKLIRATICEIIRDDKILLQYKAAGKFGEGKWNGPGGKVDKGETPEECVIREVKEETDIDVKELIKKAEHEFIFPHDLESNNYTHIFLSYTFQGEPRNMGEGELKWFKIDDIPLDKMWDDDQYWLKDVLSGKEQNMRFFFNQDNKVEKYEVIN